MALMYRPRNSHCIYVDRKSNQKVLQAATAIVECYREAFLKVNIFPNSFTLVKSSKVKLGKERLKSDQKVLQAATAIVECYRETFLKVNVLFSSSSKAR